MKNKKVLTSVCVIMALFIFFATAAFAYTLMPWGYYSNTITMDSLTYTISPYTTPFNDAMSSWTAAQTKRVATFSSGSSNKIYSQYVNDTNTAVYGVIAYNLQGLHGYTTQFQIVLNTKNISTVYNLIRSTSFHEIGHSFGLDDLSSGTAIMNINRDRAVINVPQTDDISGVNSD